HHVSIVGGPPAQEGLTRLEEPHAPAERMIGPLHSHHLRVGGEQLRPEIGSVADECEDPSHRFVLSLRRMSHRYQRWHRNDTIEAGPVQPTMAEPLLEHLEQRSRYPRGFEVRGG